MIWVLFIWVGYAGAHSTVTQHGPFKSEAACEAAAGYALKDLKEKLRMQVRTACIPKEKNG